MDFQDMAAAIKSAADSVRKTPAVWKGNKVSYTIVVKVGYEEIKKLREDGYSYDIICKIFSEKGLLGDNARPKSFCTAFLRETKRRVSKADGHNAPVVHDVKAERGDKPADTRDIQKTASGTDRRDETTSASEEEKRKKLLQLGRKVDTGYGTVTKLPDGSFDYD